MNFCSWPTSHGCRDIRRKRRVSIGRFAIVFLGRPRRALRHFNWVALSPVVILERDVRGSSERLQSNRTDPLHRRRSAAWLSSISLQVIVRAPQTERASTCRNFQQDLTQLLHAVFSHPQCREPRDSSSCCCGQYRRVCRVWSDGAVDGRVAAARPLACGACGCWLRKLRSRLRPCRRRRRTRCGSVGDHFRGRGDDACAAPRR